MSGYSIDGRWLLIEGLRIGGVVLAGFLLSQFLGVFIAAFGVELLYGMRSTLIAVIRYSTLLTALLYVITRGIDVSSPSVAPDE